MKPEREERAMGKKSDLLSQILTHGPSQNTIFLILTEMKQEGRCGEIIQECLKALNAYPGDIRLMKLLAESYLKAGFIGLCETELINVTKEIEKQASAFKLQARIYKQQKRFDAAVASLKKYLALNPDDREAIDLLDSVLQQEARGLFEKTVTTKTEGQPDSIERKAGAKSTEEILSVEYPETETVEEKIEGAPRKIPFEAGSTEKTGMADIEPGHSPAVEVDKPAPETETGRNKTPGDTTETAADEMEETLIELATPTLAELYFSQGQRRKAIETYEKWIFNNPDDKRSEQRLNEMKTGQNNRAEPGTSKEDPARVKTEKFIEILERWLARIQK